MDDQNSVQPDVWAQGSAYEPYVGRWSRLIAPEFLAWLKPSLGQRWLDVGCGTGALSQTILQTRVPSHVVAVDRSSGFLEFAQHHILTEQARFVASDAQALPVKSGTFDAAISGLMLNFISQPVQAVSEMARAVKPGGMVAVYVWDYAGKMEMMRYFWDAAIALDLQAVELDEGRRFPLCNPEALKDIFYDASLFQIQVQALAIVTHFQNFEDYWTPFLGGQGPAPTYVMSLSEERRNRLRDHVQAALPTAADGSIKLVARAWAARGITGA